MNKYFLYLISWHDPHVSRKLIYIKFSKFPYQISSQYLKLQCITLLTVCRPYTRVLSVNRSVW
jgi:hypothetical protein